MFVYWYSFGRRWPLGIWMFSSRNYASWDTVIWRCRVSYCLTPLPETCSRVTHSLTTFTCSTSFSIYVHYHHHHYFCTVDFSSRNLLPTGCGQNIYFHSVSESKVTSIHPNVGLINTVAVDVNCSLQGNQSSAYTYVIFNLAAWQVTNHNLSPYLPYSIWVRDHVVFWVSDVHGYFYRCSAMVWYDISICNAPESRNWWSPTMACAVLVGLRATFRLYCCDKTLCNVCCLYRTFEVCVELNLSIGATYHEKMTSMSISPEEQAK